jgi:hypothetical protein
MVVIACCRDFKGRNIGIVCMLYSLFIQELAALLSCSWSNEYKKRLGFEANSVN